MLQREKRETRSIGIILMQSKRLMFLFSGVCFEELLVPRGTLFPCVKFLELLKETFLK